MFKNVASQKFIVFAFDATTNLPKTGDAANITAYVSKDFGAVTVLADTTATEMDATNAKGFYLFDAAQAETNGDALLVSAKSSTANIVVVGAPATIFTYPTTGILAPATAGRTLVVDAAGLADANTVKLGPTGAGTAQTARDIGTSVLLSTGTGTGQLDFTSGVVKANATQWLGGTIPAVNVTGVPLVDAKYLLGTIFSTPATAGIMDINLKNIANAAVSTSTAQLGVNAVNWAGGAIPAVNVTGVPLVDLKYTLGTISPATAGSVRADAVTGAVGSVTGAVGSVTGAVGSVTGNVGGNVTGSVGSIASGGIARASFAAETGLQSIRSNTAQAGASTSITLDASASASNSFYVNCLVIITGGTGVGQARFITAYTGSTKIATVSAWVTNPDNTSTFAVMGFDAIVGATAPTAAQNATAVWQDLLSSSDFSTSSSIGALLKADIDATISSRMATYTQPTGFLAATFPTTVASTTNITSAAGIAVSSIGANVITATSIAAAALNGKGDWNTTTPPTVAAIATGVWQDTTAGDFTVSSSIGKSLYTSGNAPGAASGLALVGSNMGTVTVSDKTGFSLSAAGVAAMWTVDVSTITRPGSTVRYPLQVVDAARNKVDTTVSPAIIYQHDDSTASFKQTLLTDATATFVTKQTPSA